MNGTRPSVLAKHDFRICAGKRHRLRAHFWNDANRHNRPIASHFHSGGLEFSYLSQDLDEADGESEETIARITVRERTAEHLHDVLSGD